MAIKLVIEPEHDSPQFRFENLYRTHFGIFQGVFAFSETMNIYVNRNIHWLWEQFQKSEG